MKYLFVLFAVALCGLSACKDDPILTPDPTDDEIKMILDGSGFDNQFISFNDFWDSQSSVGYLDSLDATEVKAIAQFNNSPVSFWLRFPGEGTGNYTYNEPIPPQLDYPAEDKYFELVIGNDTTLGGIAIQQIDLQIEQYDTIGGRIKGSFEGAVYDYSSGTETVVQISNGVFDMRRRY